MHRSSSPMAWRAGIYAGVLGLLTLACAQSDVAGPEQAPFEASTYSIAPGFAKCRPLGSAYAAKYITPGRWDTLRVGPHRLIFQPNSLAYKTYITASIGADSSRSVKFGPEGLQFKSGYAPTLQLSVSNCAQVVSTMKIVYSDDYMMTVKETKSSIVNLSLQYVSAAISHFSRYAVHY